MTTSKEKNVFYVHYYESDSSGGELPLMRIEAENEDEANLICLRNSRMFMTLIMTTSVLKTASK